VSRPDYSRSRERDAAIRAQLEPLAPGERPLGLKLAVGLAGVLAVANVIGAAAGVGSESPALGVAFALLLAALAYGMWQRRYLAVLAFEALLALTLIVSAISLLFARNATAAVISLVALAVCAPVFWLLIRVMARLQVPRDAA
jgi:hypothetical protein